jgi:hypothetical protein
MLTQITLLALASGALRLCLLWALRRKFGLLFVVPEAIAGYLVLLAGMPTFLRPVPWSMSFTITLSLLLPDPAGSPFRFVVEYF